MSIGTNYKMIKAIYYENYDGEDDHDDDGEDEG